MDMYYKVTNKESETFNKLYALRKKEEEIEKNNERLIEENSKIPKIKNVYGYIGQSNVHRTTIYNGFVFENEEDVCEKTWRKSKECKGVYVPNKKYKEGKEMANFLDNVLELGNVLDLLDIVGLEYKGYLPLMYISEDDSCVLFAIKGKQPKCKDFIEITETEFKKLRG